MIEKFGAWAVYGRPLFAHEMKRITAAEAIVNAYRDRAKSENYAEWTERNPQLAALLTRAMRAAENA